MVRPAGHRRALLEAAGWLDDLGRRIPRVILSYNEERLRAKGKKPEPVAVIDQVLRVAIMISIAGVGVLLLQYVISLGSTARVALQVGFFCFNAWIIGWHVTSMIRRRLPSVQIPKRLARGECPGCLYDLAGLHPERVEAIERAIRCPECGAVWRAERVGGRSRRDA